jgi:hypothetical protein
MFQIRKNSSVRFDRLLRKDVSAVSLQLIRNFASKMGFPRVFFDMAADNQPIGRIVIEVSKEN